MINCKIIHSSFMFHALFSLLLSKKSWTFFFGSFFFRFNKQKLLLQRVESVVPGHGNSLDFASLPSIIYNMMMCLVEFWISNERQRDSSSTNDPNVNNLVIFEVENLLIFPMISFHFLFRVELNLPSMCGRYVNSAKTLSHSVLCSSIICIEHKKNKSQWMILEKMRHKLCNLSLSHSQSDKQTANCNEASTS